MKVLVWRRGGIGDTVLLLPALKALRRCFPRSHITAVGNPGPLSLAIPPADEVRSADKALWAVLFSPASPNRELRPYLRGFDLAVVYTEDEFLIRGLEKAGVRQVISWPPFPRERIHEADHLLAALTPLGIVDEDPTPRIESLKDVKGIWERLNLGERVLAVHPGSGSPEKNWSPERFAGLILWAEEELNISPLLLCGPADEEAVEGVVWALGKRPPVAEDLPLREVASVLRRCSAFVGNDSGITHIAAAVGTPTVALFGPSDPEVWAPRGPKVKVVASNRMDNLPIAAVQNALKRILP